MPDTPDLVRPPRPQRIHLDLSRDDAVVLWTILSDHKGNPAVWPLRCDLEVELFPDRIQEIVRTVASASSTKAIP